MYDPRESHLVALKRLLRYVRGTVDLGLVLHRSSTAELVVYTDADWAGCPDTRRSTPATPSSWAATWSPGRPSGSRLSPAPVLRRSTGLSLTAWRRRPGYDSSWRSSTARSPRARSSTATTSAPCISPPTPSSISGRSTWRSTYTSCATESPSAMFGYSMSRLPPSLLTSSPRGCPRRPSRSFDPAST